MEKRVKIVISDFHIGSGHKIGAVNYYDDFIYDDLFAELIEHYSTGDYARRNVELIINGDFFDFIKVPVDGKYPDKITEDIAMNKLQQCIEGHPLIFEALKKFAAGKRKYITYMPGNHDVDMLFPVVADYFEKALTTESNRERVKMVLDRDALILDGGIHIHHGHQFEPNNAFDYNNLFVKKSMTGKKLEKPFIRLPWGTLFLLKVIIPLKPERFYIDQIRPFKNFMKWGLIFDTFFMLKLLGKGFFYFLKTRLNLLTQPGVSFSKGFQQMVDSIVFYPSLENFAFRILKRVHGVRFVIMGHDHYERCRSFGENKLYINTGTWINMINLDASQLGKSESHPYAIIEYGEDGREPQVTLMNWRGKYEKSTPIWF